jgi:hypothetical protein
MKSAREMKPARGARLEDRTARLTILIDPRKKALLERLCEEEDATPSQVVRRLIRGYILERTGEFWPPAASAQAGAVERGTARRESRAHEAQRARAPRRR